MITCVDDQRFFFFLMIRRPPRSTLDRSSAASDVYKRQLRFRPRLAPADDNRAERYVPRTTIQRRGTADVLKHTMCRRLSLESTGRAGLNSLVLVESEADCSDAATPVAAVLQSERPSVRLRDLARQHQPDPRPGRLGREERNEEVSRVGEARTLVLDDEGERAVLTRPSDVDVAARLQRRVDRVAQEVDEELVELVAVGAHRRGRS